MTTQEKILEAKKLLEQYAPKGEFLAYINRDEAKTLKELGGSGIIIEETGIPSFWAANPLTWIMAATTVLSFMGSMRTMKTMSTGAEWDKHNQRIKSAYSTIKANDRARLLLSQKRAAQGARGVQIRTGSTLKENNQVVENLEDLKFWINKGTEMSIRDIDLKLAGLLQDEAWKASTSLLEGAGKVYSSGVTTS